MLGKKKSDEFYDLLNEEMSKVMTTTETFMELITNYENVDDKIANMKALETECDMQAHKIYKLLASSNSTGFDRSDIFDIVREIDNIVDSMEEVSNRFGVFAVKEIRSDLFKLAEILLQAVKELRSLIEHFSEIRKPNILLGLIIEVNRIENEGDLIYRKALTHLFRDEKDALEIIKWKHIYEQIEASIDSCENVANLIEGVIMKYA